MIEVRHLNKTYDRGSRNANHVLRDLSFTLPDTGFVCIVGESGCGKTSLLNAVGGLDRFDNGTLTTDNISVSRYGSREMETERNNHFGYIFQNYYLLSEHSVAYNVYLGLHSLNLSHREKLARVREALKAVNMEHYARRTVSDLSGGQQQRVAIARALARRPKVIFADEPTGNLDEENTINICTILRRISRTSLVIMVTHELRIARFFADRIITLSSGVVANDNVDWEREPLTAEGDSTIYSGECREERYESQSLKLRVLQKEDAAPTEITVAVLNDRVVIKVSDARAVSCTRPEETPVIRNGIRPVLTLESVDNEPSAMLVEEEDSAMSGGRAGRGLSVGMMAREAASLLRGRGNGLRRLGAWIFLAAMTVLTSIAVGDYLTVSSIDPKEFVKTDSHVLALSLEGGPELPASAYGGIRTKIPEFTEYLEQSGLDFDYIPNVGAQLFCTVEDFAQMKGIKDSLPAFSYASLDRLDENKLILGRMPENRNEVVIDRWVLDVFLARDGVIQNNISDISQMLGARLSYLKKAYSPTIVGICDCGNPTLYLSKSALISIGVAGYHLMSYSELCDLVDPDTYLTHSGLPLSQVELAEGECIVNADVAGEYYLSKIGSKYGNGSTGQYVVKDVFTQWGVDAAIIVRDDALDDILSAMIGVSADFVIYCGDKAVMKSYLAQGMPENLRGQIQLSVNDANGRAWAYYEQASAVKADARTIVTVTIIALCMVMLYLLQRSCVQQRIGMMAVYRLLGIPGHKLTLIFTMESMMLCLLSVLPAAAVTWTVIAVMNRLPSLEFEMVFTWQASAVIFILITVYHLIVSLVPVWSLLRLPPARLAAKYDI